MTIDEIKKIAESTPQTVESVASSVMNRAKSRLPLNLQFFAEPGEDDPKDPPVDDPEDDDLEKKKKDDPEKLSFTQEELDKMMADREARAIKKAEKEKEDAVKEAAKLAKMNTDQKKEYEFEKLKRENEALKAAQNKYELGKEASKILSESGIAATDDILDFVVRDDAEKTGEAVRSFSELVDKVSEEKMKEKLKGKPPKKNQSKNGFKNPFSKEHFNLTEQGRLLRDDPNLYNQLKAQAGQ